jgi:hypothetical protein
MSDQPRPLGIKEAIREIAGDDTKLSVAAALLFILSLLLPVATMRVHLVGIVQTSSITGRDLFGGYGLLALVATVLAASCRFPVGVKLRPYQKLLDLAALVCVILAPVMGFWDSPQITKANSQPANQIGALLNGMVGDTDKTIILTGSIGLLPLLLSVVALLRGLQIAVRRD